MQLGPLEVSWMPAQKLEHRVRGHVRNYMMALVDSDQEVRALIARCSRSVAKDYIGELTEQAKAEQAKADHEYCNPESCGYAPTAT